MMRAQQIRKFDMLRHVQQFLDAFSATLGAVNATAARKELDKLVDEMFVNETLQATSTLNAKSQTAAQEVLRRDLVNHHMRPVATIAAAHLRDVPGFKALQLPRKDLKVAVLVQDATAMAEAARSYQQVFVENGRPENFADALVAAAGAVRASIDTRAKNISSKAGARDGLEATATRAHLVIRLLDAQVKSALVDDPKTLAAWKSVKRIGKGKVVPIEATLLASTTPPAPTTTEVKAA
jgi:membrane carboxypeptidase/penicillin-binding protein